LGLMKGEYKKVNPEKDRGRHLRLSLKARGRQTIARVRIPTPRPMKDLEWR